MRTLVLVASSAALAGAAFAQNSLTSALEDLAKVEGKAKQGVIAEYSSVLLDTNEFIYGRIYFKDKLIRIDEVINIKGQGKITEPVLFIRVSDYSAGNPMGEHASTTFSIDQEFTSPQEVLDYVRDEPHPSSSFTKNRQQSAFVHLLRRYGWNGTKWLSQEISAGTDASGSAKDNAATLSWVSGGQVKKHLTIKKGSLTVVSELTSKPVDEKVSSFRGYFFVEKPASPGVYTVSSESDYSNAPDDVKQNAIRDLGLDSSAKRVWSEVHTLHKETFSPIDDKVFKITPNSESVITDYRSGDYSKIVDGKRTVIGNIHEKTPKQSKGLPTFWLGVAATTLLASAGAVALKIKRSK